MATPLRVTRSASLRLDLAIPKSKIFGPRAVKNRFLRLDVPMDGTRRVRSFQPRQDDDHQFRRLHSRHPAAATERLGNRLPVQAFHDEIRQPFRRPPSVGDLHDRRVLELGQRAPLTLHSEREVFPMGEVLVEHLHHEALAQSVVLHFVDAAHAAAGQFRERSGKESAPDRVFPCDLRGRQPSVVLRPALPSAQERAPAKPRRKASAGDTCRLRTITGAGTGAPREDHGVSVQRSLRNTG